MGEKAAGRDLDGSELRIALIVSRYNEDISGRLLKGALDALQEHGVQEPEVHWVPGAIEIPLVALTLAESSRFDALVCLGCVINGETAHFQFVAGECARGVMHVQLDTGVPCAFGVLTTFDRDQALARSGPKNNKGFEAAETAIETANLLRKLQQLDREDAAV
jgi:6,7-dimethyl-8-ribityllumazine synthase